VEAEVKVVTEEGTVVVMLVEGEEVWCIHNQIS